MKVIVAGSRTIIDKDIVFKILDANKLYISEVVCGLAKGIDSLGKDWALQNNIPVKEFPADWKTLGKAAGHIRNCQMGDYADALLAIWDGKSRGTKHMIDYANSKRLIVRIRIIENEDI